MKIEQAKERIESLKEDFIQECFDKTYKAHQLIAKTYIIEALKIAIRSLKVLQEVKKIIDIDNSLIQEDVIKYKMICELVEKTIREVEE